MGIFLSLSWYREREVIKKWDESLSVTIFFLITLHFLLKTWKMECQNMFWIVDPLFPLLMFITFYTFQMAVIKQPLMQNSFHIILISVTVLPLCSTTKTYFASKTSVGINHTTIIFQSFIYFYPADFQFFHIRRGRRG